MGGYRSEYSATRGRTAGQWEGYKGHTEGSQRMRPYETRDAESAELVKLIKTAQRNDADWRTKWVDYCQEHGNGTMDPSRHGAKFLIDAVRILGLPGDEVAGEEMTVHKLVEDIKNRQRTSTAQHSAWTDYCDERGDDSHYDPAHYDKAFLEAALEYLKNYEGEDDRPARGRAGKGARAAPVKTGGKGVKKPGTGLATHLQQRGETHQDLIDIVKTMQKEDPAAHVSWQEYCEARGEGTFDPKRHDFEFLVSGITFMRKSVFLVNSISEMTRRSSMERSKWVEYCNEMGDGVLDPMLHNTDFLEKAFNSIAPRAAARSRTAIPWFLKFSPGTLKALGELDESDIVSSLRLLQKEHPEVSFAWKIYCDVNGDRTYDPSRHTERFLKDAVRDLKTHFLHGHEVRE